MIGAITITQDYLMAAMYIMATLGLLGAYVTEFPILNTLYGNEVVHKTAISSLFGILFGLLIGLALAGGANESDSAPVSSQGKFLLTWLVMSAPGYLLKVFLITRVNKRDLEEEERIREEKKKKRKSSGGGPPIMDRDSF